MAESTHRTITLTGRPPVKIRSEEWDEIGRGWDAVDSRNGTPLPDYESARWDLRVRRHADGRAVVYGVASAPTNGWPSHGASNWRGGEQLAAGTSTQDLVRAVQRVGANLIERGGAPVSIVDECIASLPAEEI